MAFKIGNGIDLQQTEIQNFVVQNLSSAPSSPKLGQEYFNSASKVKLTWNGVSWRPSDAAALTDGSVPIAALAVNPLSRANHTGTQVASTISDLTSTVKSYTLDSFATPVANVSAGGYKFINVAAGVGNTDAVNVQQVQQWIAAAVAGQKSIKNPVRGVFTTNVSLSGVQNTTDSVTGSTTDPTNRWLVTANTDATQNGIYQMNSGAWTRVTDADEPAEWLEGTEVLVLSGTQYGGTIWRQTGSGTGGVLTPGTSTFNFTLTSKINTYSADGITLSLTGTQFAVNYGSGLTVVAGKLALDPTVAARKFAGTITGDGSTTTFTVTHGLGTQDLTFSLRDSTNAAFWTDTVFTNANAMTITFGTAPANGATYRVVVTG